MTQKQYRLRFEGEEYGPFSEKKLKAFLKERSYSDDVTRDAYFDEASATWLPLSKLAEPVAEEDDVWKNVNLPSTYIRITMAGLLLAVLWASVFVGIRLWTGYWPGQHDAHRPPPMMRALTDTAAPADTMLTTPMPMNADSSAPSPKTDSRLSIR